MCPKLNDLEKIDVLFRTGYFFIDIKRNKWFYQVKSIHDLFLCPRDRRSGGILFLSCLSSCHSVIFSETLTLLITFEQWMLELWYFTWVFLVIRPVRGYHYLLPCDLVFDSFWWQQGLSSLPYLSPVFLLSVCWAPDMSFSKTIPPMTD